MQSTASLCGAWLCAVAPFVLSASTDWASGLLAGRSLAWAALVWVVMSGLPKHERRASDADSLGRRASDADSLGRRASDATDTTRASGILWIALPVLAAACALDVVAGRDLASAITTLGVVLVWMWFFSAASARVAQSSRAASVYAALWFAAVPGALVLERALAWSASAGSGGAPRWLASAAASTPLAWITRGLAHSNPLAGVDARRAGDGSELSVLLAPCAVVLAMWALTFWLARTSGGEPAPIAEGNRR